jgi:hypothetical protein
MQIWNTTAIFVLGIRYWQFGAGVGAASQQINQRLSSQGTRQEAYKYGIRQGLLNDEEHKVRV